MQTRPSVLIMMATYNGENYLKEQIESIQHQTYQNWNLIIQDDGSKDATLKIIDDYCAKDSRITKAINLGLYHGVYNNFHLLANKCKSMDLYDFYMFSDQDDVWDDDKIEKILYRISDKQKNKPIFYYANMRLIDGNGNILNGNMNKLLGIQYINKISTFFSHNVFGCNCLMNRAAFLSVPIIDVTDGRVNILAHDNLYAKFSALLGTVIYDDDCIMSYRRHGLNVTSKYDYKFNIYKILHRIFKVNDLAKDHALTYNQSLITIELMHKLCEFDNKNEILIDIKSTIYSGGIRALIYLKRNHVTWGRTIKGISRKLILLTGIYKKYLLTI